MFDFLLYGIHVIAVKVQSQELTEEGVRWVLPSLPVALTSPPSSPLSLHRCERGNHGLVSTSFSLLLALYLSHTTISLSYSLSTSHTLLSLSPTRSLPLTHYYLSLLLSLYLSHTTISLSLLLALYLSHTTISLSYSLSTSHTLLSLSPTRSLPLTHYYLSLPSVLVRVDDPVRDPTLKAYIFEVSKACGLIQYRQFRLDWLNYQRCQMDVVSFCKKTKLLFRGDK